MRKLLNTLFVTTQGVILHRDGEAINIRDKGESILKMPIHLLNGVVCYGAVTVTQPCMALCAENDVLISFLTEYGKFVARVTGPVSGNVLLRKTQYRYSEDSDKSSLIARRILTSKISNSRITLQRFCRDHGDAKGVERVKNQVDSLKGIIRLLENSENLDTIRGREGEAARRYFSVFDNMILTNRDTFSFSERSRRPPMDPVNCLLSFIYTLLVHDVESACETVGLDPAVGFLHRDRPGRPGLALDLMEELRSFLADRLVLSLINRNQLKKNDFEISETGSVTLTKTARKVVLTAWQMKKKEIIIHPFIEEKIEIGLIPYVQALLLARFIRGDLNDYPAFLWK